MDNVSQLPANVTQFSQAQALLAARQFRSSAQLILFTLALATVDALGVVQMTAAEIARRTGLSRVTILPHLRELLRDTIITRHDPLVSFTYRWNLERVAELARVTLEADQTVSRRQYSLCQSPAVELRASFLEAERTVRHAVAARRGQRLVWCGVSTEPSDEGYEILAGLVSLAMQATGHELDVVARHVWHVWLSCKGRTNARGEWIDYASLQHPFSYLVREWQRNPDFARKLDKRLSPERDEAPRVEPKPFERRIEAPSPVVVAANLSGSRSAIAALAGGVS